MTESMTDRVGLETVAGIIDLAASVREEQGVSGPELFDYRGALFAVIDNPTSETWSEAYNLPLHASGVSEPISLWTAVLHYTSYDYREHVRGTVWPIIPSPGQIISTIVMINRGNPDPRSPRLAGPWELETF